jgi:hypothetical protein
MPVMIMFNSTIYLCLIIEYSSNEGNVIYFVRYTALLSCPFIWR